MRKLYILLLILAVFSSCSDWLDIKPKGKIIPVRVEDYRLLMDQSQSRGSSSGFVESYGNVLYSTDDVSISDEGFDNNYGLTKQSIYTWAEKFYLDEEEDGVWSSLYSQIYVCNVVITEVLETEGDEDEKKKLYAEAKIQRAYAYFLLTNIYGKHYNEETADTDLAVPLNIIPIIEGSLSRATVAEAYKLIEDDISEVIDFLPETSELNHRPTKAAAYALLSRVLLYKGDYNNSMIAADKSLAVSSFLYDYNALGKNAWYSTVVDLPENPFNKEVLLNKSATNNYSLIYPSNELKSLYNADADLRWKGQIMLEWFPPYTGTIYIIEYTVGRQMGLTVSEVMLNKAECLARVGDYGEAINILNTIREKRFETDKYVALSASGRDDAIDKVKEERRRELAFHGLRWFDLKRYNVNDSANITLNRTVKGKEYVLAPNSRRWVFPIANKYIIKNPEIEQNLR